MMAFSYAKYRKKNPYGSLGPSPATVARVNKTPIGQVLGITKPPPPRPLTAQQWADQQAQRIVDEQLAAIKQAQDARNEEIQAQAQQQALAAQRFAQMVQGLGIDKAINSIYSSAGHDVAGYAQGFAGDIRDTAAADAAAATRMVSGTGQEGAVRNEGVDMGDVIYGVGGAIPGQNMAAAGAAQATDAARQPGFLLEQRLGQAAADMASAQSASDSQFLDAILQAKLGKSDISKGLYDQRSSDQLAQQKFNLQQLNDQRSYWMKMQALYLSQKKYKLAADAENRARHAEARYTAEAAGRDVDGNLLPGYVQAPDGSVMKRSDWLAQQREGRYRNKDKGLDANGNLLPGYKRDKKGNVVKTGKAAQAKAMTPGQKAEVIRSVLGKEEDMKKDIASIAKTAGLDRILRMPTPNVASSDREDRGAAAKQAAARAKVENLVKRELYARYAGYAITPEAKRQLRALVARVVREYRPGASTGGGGLLDGLVP